ncbi:hypothetical protein GCM10010393_41680 [Streptomyces gobitricini]|uniref:Secreted protein n=1 Tax=Streptomyces gobitricini TaxID=68211 RepID=A0ABP5ZYS0_9ACTN
MVGVEEWPAALLVVEPLAGYWVAGVGVGVVVGALPQDGPGRVPPRVDRGEHLLGRGGAGPLLRELALAVEPLAKREAVADDLDRRAEVAVVGCPAAGVPFAYRTAEAPGSLPPWSCRCPAAVAVAALLRAWFLAPAS